jgi:hypothetical protein
LNTSATNSVWVCWAKFCFGIDLVTSRESWLCLVIRGYVPFVGVAGSYCRVVFLNSQYNVVYRFCVLYFTCCYVCFVRVNCYVTYFDVCVNLHPSFHIWGCNAINCVFIWWSMTDIKQGCKQPK